MEVATGGKTFTDRTVSIPCIQSGLSDDEVLELGGLNTEQMIVLTVRKSAYATAKADADGNPVAMAVPAKKTRIRFDGEEYRIAKIKNDPTGTFMKFFCECPNAGI